MFAGLTGLHGLLLILLFPLALLVIGWSMRGLPNLPLPQTRPGRLPEAHWETTIAPAVANGTFSLVAAEGLLWALGGDMATGGETAVYDPAKDRWDQGPALPAGRGAFRAATLGGTIFAVGGYATGLDETAAVDLLTPGADRWQQGVPLPAPRSGHAVVAADERLFVIGGSSGGKPVASIDVYDPALGTWRQEATIPTPRDSLAATFLNGKLYILGGWAAGAPVATVEIYDLATKAWSVGPPLPAPLAEPEAITFKGRVHAVQGNSHFVYDARIDSWLEATPTTTPRTGARLAAIGEILYAVGGTDPATGAATGTAERYEPGAPATKDPFRIIGYNPAGAASVVGGFIITVTLMTITLRAGRRRPEHNRDDPWPEDPAEEGGPPEVADPGEAAPTIGGARSR